MTDEIYDETISAQQKKVALTKDMQAQMQVQLDALQPKPGEHILDIGCGNGVLVGKIADQVGSTGQACGVDGSSAMVEMASDLVPNASFQHTDATRLPFKDGALDAVICSQLLCFIANLDEALAEAFRVLKPRGRFVILDTDWESLVWNTKDQSLLSEIMVLLKQGYHSDCVPRTLKRELRKVGFEVKDFFAHPICSLEPVEDSYAQQMSAFIRPLLEKHPAFSSDLADRWEADQKAIIAEDAYFFSLNRFVFTAQKPDGEG